MGESATMQRLITGEEAMLAAGAALARGCPPGPLVLYLVGELGAGKTTLARGFLRGLGYAGPVKSPTYTLLESYEAAGRTVHHLDLYRLVDPDELEYIGLRECLTDDAVVLIEWPMRGGAHVPPPDIVLRLDHVGDGRVLRSEAGTAPGEEWLHVFDEALQASPSGVDIDGRDHR